MLFWFSYSFGETVTEEEYDQLARGFSDITGGASEISHEAWTEAFSAMYGEEEKDLAAYFEAIFSALDVDKNDSISVSPLRSFCS